MSRNIILFLCAFLATIGISIGIFWLLGVRADDLSKIVRKDTPQPTVTAPAQPEQPKAEEPARPEPKPVAEPEPAPAPAPKPAPALRTEPVVTTPTAEPEPAPQPTPAPLKLAETPRNAEHAAALTAAAAMATENPQEALQRLVEKGEMTPEAAAALAAWAANNKVKAVEEVGNSRRANGDRVTRYRIVSENGQEDLLLDVVTTRDGSTIVESVKTTSADKTTISATCDSITVAEGFVEAVRRGDMNTARKMITGTEVSDATVAGLCMIFEEGEFKLRQQAPIRNTFENETNSGYIVYVESRSSDKPANIGMELEKVQEKGWLVKAVGLDALLSSYEGLATAEGGHYFPIVKNPKGGDSLALFFAFNESALTPRSVRQLQIVAELLKQSQGKLNISGHTDDVGSEGYNQKLSERRADAVKEALVSFGVKAEQITTHGLGKSQPRRTYASDASEQEVNYIRGENRRAEIYLDFES